MEISLKQRLVGAAVLIALGVIFIPMLLDGSGGTDRVELEMQIPPEPIYEAPPTLPPVPAETPEPTEPAGVEDAPEPREETPRPSLKSVPEERVSAPEPKPEQAEPPPAETAKATAEPGAWVVQVGAFSEESNALAVRDKLRKAGFAAFVEPVASGGGKVYRVKVGPEIKRETAEALRDRLAKEQGFDKSLVVGHP